MNKRLLRITAAALVAAAGAVAGCRKKEAGPSPSPRPPESQAPSSAETAPPPAPRATDLTKVDLPLAGALKEVAAKVIDKESDDKAKGLIKVKVFEGTADVGEHTQIEVRKPGADPEENKPEIRGWAGNDIAVLPGTWDLRLVYDEGPLCKTDGWIRGVAVVAGKLWKAEATFNYPMQYVRIFATLDGKDATANTRAEVFKAGADMEEIKPLNSFWGSNKQAIAAGSYDLRLLYDSQGVKAKRIAKNFTVGGDHAVKKETVALEK